VSILWSLSPGNRREGELPSSTRSTTLCALVLRFYRHRVNSIAELDEIPPEHGIEFDLRSDGDDVIVTHDPFTRGPTIEEFFPRIKRRPCIFNVKCEGIESRVLMAASKHGIDDFFFLDLSIPAAIKMVRTGEHRVAVRYSEYEPVEGVLAWRGLARWVWVDCFTAYPTEPRAWKAIAEAFQLCLVSPELQGHGLNVIADFRASLADLRFDAVCTKRRDCWDTLQ